MNNDSAISSAGHFNLSLPRWVFIQLLEHCNLRCSMCYEWGDNGSYREKPSLKKLDLEVIKGIIKECEPAHPYYELYGGEPLLYPHIEEVLTAIKFAGSKVHLPTNGTLLEKMAEMLVETSPERIWVSLDGPSRINDAQRGAGVFEKAVKGIDRLYALRAKSGSSYPQIGVGMCITPTNHGFIEEFFFDALDLSKLDCITLELQAYLTENNHQNYERVLQREFGVLTAPIAKGFVCDPTIFADVDYGLIARQVAKLAEHCRARGIYLNTYPQEMSQDNIRKYFTAEWHSMSRTKKRCSFPWISTEINARGDVTSCHAFYDLTLGNVYESSLGEIWRGEGYVKYRQHLRKNLFPICQACCLFYNEKPPVSGLISTQSQMPVV